MKNLVGSNSFKIYFIILVLFLFKASVWSNDLKLTGKVTDAETDLPIEFASVSIDGISVGVITNEKGEFELNFNEKFIGQNLIFSNIAYITDTIKLESNITEFSVALVPARFEIADVIVKPVNPLTILHKAISEIPNNYESKPQIYEAYYRELVKLDTAFVKYADASCLLNYCGYQEYSNYEQASHSFYSDSGLNLISIPLAFPQAFFVVPHQRDTAYILEVRRSDNLERFENVPGFKENFNRFNIGGGPLHITSADLVKNRQAILDTNSWKYYQFKYEGNIDKPGNIIQVISFKPKKVKENAIWSGHIYIDKVSSAIVQIDISAAEKARKYLENYSTEYIVELSWWGRHKLDGIKRVERITAQTDQQISVRYAKTDSSWHLHSIKMENSFVNRGDIFPEQAYNTYLLLQINRQVPSINLAENYVFKANRYNYLFQYQKPYNKEFWKVYNLPKPTGELYQALQDLERTTNLEEQFQKH